MTPPPAQLEIVSISPELPTNSTITVEFNKDVAAEDLIGYLTIVVIRDGDAYNYILHEYEEELGFYDGDSVIWSAEIEGDIVTLTCNSENDVVGNIFI